MTKFDININFVAPHGLSADRFQLDKPEITRLLLVKADNPLCTYRKPGIERVQALDDISRSVCVVISTKPVHRLQIHPTVHN